MRFDGKVAVISGAAGGIGGATVLLMASEGCNIAALDISADGLLALAGAANGLPGELAPLGCDAFDPVDVERCVQATLDRWGRIDILVNCVGGSTVIPNTGRPMEELELAEWKRLLDFNLDAMFLGCRAVIPTMKRQGAGKIINLSSRSATGLGDAPAAYAAAKAGIVGFTMRLAHQLGPFGITVNAVAPDTTLTERIAVHVWAGKSEADRQAYLNTVALRRLGQPEDQAKVIAFLASSDADFISGQTIHVNGGM